MAKAQRPLSAKSVTVLKLIAEGRSYEQILARLPDKGYDPSALERTRQPDP